MKAHLAQKEGNNEENIRLFNNKKENTMTIFLKTIRRHTFEENKKRKLI